MTQKNKERHIVLVVAEDHDSTGAIIEALGAEEYDFITALNVPEALSNITYRLPNIIISEVELPDINGFELLEKIRRGVKTRLIPFIFISRSQDVCDRVHAYQTGADAILVKPVIPEEIRALAHSKLKHIDDFYHLSVTDELTRLYNRREFLKKFNDEINNRENRVISLALMDLDHFKKINDTHGHQMGDNVLMNFADVLMSSAEDRFFPARFGGEEFVMLFPGLEAGEAKVRVDGMRDDFASRSFQGEKKQVFHVSFSAGIAEYPAMASNLSHLLSRADHALYAAKNDGRGKTLVYSPVMARNDRFWEHLKQKRDVYVDGENRDMVSGLGFLPNVLESIVGLNYEIQSIGAMIIRVRELMNMSGIRGVRNLQFDIGNIVSLIASACENHFPSDTFFGIDSFYEHEFVVLFPSIVDFSINVKKFKDLCGEIFTEIEGGVMCQNFDLGFASNVIYYDRKRPWGLVEDIKAISDKVESVGVRKKNYTGIKKKLGRVVNGEIPGSDFFTLDHFFNVFNLHREFHFFAEKEGDCGDTTLDILLAGTKKKDDAAGILGNLAKSYGKKLTLPVLIPWDSRTDLAGYVRTIGELFRGKDTVVMINEAMIDGYLAGVMESVARNLPDGVSMGLDNCYIGNDILNMLSAIEFRAVCFSGNITRNIHAFKERIKIINGIKIFADQVGMPVLVRNIASEDEYNVVKDLKIFYASGPYMHELLKNRSEERRVGKECRSRWSPYH